jgi:hypothetical protein
MTDAVGTLLGEKAVLPRQGRAIPGEVRTEGDVVVARVAYPSEAHVLIPTVLLAPASAPGKLPVHIRLAAEGRETLLTQTGAGSPRDLARQGNLVVLPDVRTYGELFTTGGQNAGAQRQAWERNGIIWGRPVPGLAATDLRAVLDGLAARADADLARVTVTTQRSGDLAIGALGAMVLDPRIAVADLDFAGASFDNRKLPLVACVLQYGDVWQWAAAVADRRLTLHNLPAREGEREWAQRAFALAGNTEGLVVDDRP